MDDRWDGVRRALENAEAITWDGCHKIYVAMDTGQVEQFTWYGYDMTPVDDVDEALATLREWWGDSCALRFISAVSTEDNPNEGWTHLIPQFADEEDE